MRKMVPAVRDDKDRSSRPEYSRLRNECQSTLTAALDPIAAPLTYPGAAPDGSAVLVTEINVLDVRPSRTRPLGEWRVRLGQEEDRALDQILLEYEASERLSWMLSRNDDQQTYSLEFRVRRAF